MLLGNRAATADAVEINTEYWPGQSAGCRAGANLPADPLARHIIIL